MSSTNPSSTVGRDELAALLGASHASDMVAAAGTTASDIAKRATSLNALAGKQQRLAAGGGGAKNAQCDEDVSKMDRAQAAALVARQFAGGTSGGIGGASSSARHRAAGGKRKRMMQHHLLAGDLLDKGGVASVEEEVADFYGGKDASRKVEGGNNDDENEGFAIRKESVRRKKTEAKVLVRRRGDESEQQHRRGRHSSSESDSESSSKSLSSSDVSSRGRNRRRRRIGESSRNRRSRSASSSSSSASEDEADRRRQRARERARMNESNVRNESADNENGHKVHTRREEDGKVSSGKPKESADETMVEKEELRKPRHTKGDDDNNLELDEKTEKESNHKHKSQKDALVQNKKRSNGRDRRNRSNSSSSNDSSSSSSSSDDDSSTSSSSSSDNDIQHTMPLSVSKPLFVPKSKRGTISEVEAQQQKLEETEERRAKEKERRALQSRALVAEVVAVAGKNGESSANTGLGDAEEFDVGEGGEFTAVPDDSDPIEEDYPELANAERDAWEVRELIRILREVDEAMVVDKEKKELERRRAMTDEERLEEDRRSGKYRAPGQARRLQKDGGGKDGKSSESNYLQKFHHRGAFYMDEDTLDQAGKDDVRHRAAEYSRAATGDIIDKRALPEVMQVKNFGLAGYSTKYKGLAKEDTTDKSMIFLPVRGPGRRDGGGDKGRHSHNHHHGR